MSGSSRRRPLEDRARWKGRRVGVIGAGRSGVASALFLNRLGARVLLSDRKKIAARLPRSIETEQGHSEVLLEQELLIRSPGVSGHLKSLERAARRGVPRWSEIELGSRFARYRDLVAITGTNGKTTTTTLVGELFKAARRPTLVGGNIGTPLVEWVDRATPRSTLVIEASSYQLEDIETFHPTISAILNVTPDHLEHHGTLRAYAAAKARIFENQTRADVCVLNADDRWCRALARRCRANLFWFSRRRAPARGIWFRDGVVHLRWGGRRAAWRLKTRLPGPHNVENILASVAIAVAGGVALPAIRRVLERFKGVEHRLEEVRTLNGVRYINDSKGTNVDSTRVALASFSEPLWVIMGGRGKGAPYAPLRPLVRRGVRGLLLIGEDTPAIKKALGELVRSEDCGAMPRAVARARQLARPGEVVLLSPACASFDQYGNFEERGRHFKRLVRALR